MEHTPAAVVFSNSSAASHAQQASARAGCADFPIAIIGAGFAGIGAAIRLKQAGIHSFTMFERASEVGGTWRDNIYPGAACDVPSHVYSLSFEQHPDWSRKFSPSDEIQDYLLALVNKWRLREHLRFGSEIVEARFDDAGAFWTLRDKDGAQHRARVVISCVGGLVDPALPEIEGLDNFGGELFHTARWKRDCKLNGLRVGVIGTGASAVQVVPAIAPQVAKLCVFQRTPGWVVPKLDRSYPSRLRRLFARFPLLLRASRFFKYATSELRGPMIFLDAPRLSALGERMSLRHLHAQVRNPELRRKLRPSFQFGCKRVLISDDYWASFERDNVELVSDAIQSVEASGVRSVDGVLRELDVLVLATGFDVGLSSAPFPVFGRAGQSLAAAWQGGAHAYQGMSVAGFPNWFILMGPNTGPGHTSVLVYTEAQIAHVLHAIRRMQRCGWKSIEVRPEVMQRYNDGLQRRMRNMVWTSGCNSWYLSEDGSNHSLYPGFASEYVLRAHRFRASAYRIEAG